MNEPKRILVVDPSTQSREAIEDIFNLRGDQVVFARDEPEALAAYRESPFDLVLIEVLLPRGNGYSVCAQLREIENEVYRRAPILLMGAVLRNFNLAHEARIKHGADDVLVKPFDARDLRRKLAYYLDHIDPDKIETDLAYLAPGEEKAHVRVHVEPLQMSGSLRRSPFGRLLGGFSQLGVTGVLHLRSGKVTKRLHFQDGNLVYISGGSRRECLGWILVAEGWLTHETLFKALAKMRESGKKLGEALIEAQTISPHQLFQALQKEAAAKALNLFRWRDGWYWFEPTVQAVAADVVPLTIEVEKILRQGIALVHDKAALDREFEPWGAMVARPADRAAARIAKLGLSRAERKLWDQIDGETKVGDLLARAGFDPVAVRRFLYLLLCLDLVVLEVMPDAPMIPRNLLVPKGDDAYRRRLQQRFAQVMPAPLGQVFPASDQELPNLPKVHRDACRGLYARRYFAALDPLTRAKADAVFDRLSEAFAYLSADDSSAVRQPGFAPASALDRGKVLDAELVFQQGMAAFAHENFLEAVDRFQAAIELDENTADYHAYLGYALYKQKGELNQLEPTMAIRHLNRAMEMDLHAADAYLFLGHIYWDLGLDKRSEGYYEEALLFDSNNREALQQLRLIFTNRRAAETAAAEEEAKTRSGLPKYIRRVRGVFNQIQNQNHYEVLGVTADFDPKTLQKTYFDLAAQYRPAELYDRLDPLTREQADEIFHRVSIAYAVLSNEAAREKYEKDLTATVIKSGRVQPVDAKLRQAADDCYQRAMRHWQNREIKNALEQIAEARRHHPTEARYLAWHGFLAYVHALSTTGSEMEIQSAAARESLRQALALDAANAEAHLFLGKIYRLEHKPNLAADHLNNALLADPNNLEALQEYRSLHSKSDTSGPVSLYQKLSTAQDKLYADLGDRLQEMGKKTYFELLGLTPDADKATVKQAYDELVAALVLVVDPQQAPTDLRERAASIRARLDRILRILSDHHLRNCYQTAWLDFPDSPASQRANDEAAVGEESPAADRAEPADAGDKSPFWTRLRGKRRK
jgi:CheY-like chemotaxis protein